MAIPMWWAPRSFRTISRLGAAGDADLVRRIGHATAVEIEVTGIDWNFSPTVAVAQDDRWGRTYESYSENRELVASLGAALVEGLQGDPDNADYLGTGRVIATAKHFFGDGGTDNGVDQGEVTGDLAELMEIHAYPYPATIEAGVEAIMASFNSINGRKMHGNEQLLTGVLREQMGFDGLVVGDWNGHGQVAGCTVTDCPQSLLAGLDIYMVPDDWKGLMETLIAQVGDGTIPMSRVDEAVERVLRVKYRAGLLDDDAQRPSERGVAGRFDMLASPEHRAIAREAVARSQVILKNDGVLPLSAGANVLVAGSSGRQHRPGCWRLDPHVARRTGTGSRPVSQCHLDLGRIERGCRGQLAARATLSPDGSFTQRPDVAVVVFGEVPYAEFAGDRPNLALTDEEGLTLLRGFAEQDIPTVAVFLSGRPMWMNRELNAADAFVASWLPGSEGAGIADILTGAREATGRLSFSWPANCAGEPLNGPEGALFPFGYGRSLGDTTPLAELNEDCDALLVGPSREVFASGRLGDGVIASVGAGALPNLLGSEGGVTARGYDREAQEDSRQITMAAGSQLALTQEDDSGGAYRITYEVLARPTGPVTLMLGEDGTVDLTPHFAHAFEKGWREMVITQACAGSLGQTITFATESDIAFRIAEITREDLPEGTECSF